MSTSQSLGGVGSGSGPIIPSHFSKNFPKKKFLINLIIPTFVLINYIMETMTVQKLAKSIPDSIALAATYYGLISSLNNLQLTEREIQLLAYSAVRGSISYATVREEFCKQYNSSFPTVNNIVSKLKRSGILVKNGKHIVVNPRIALDFSKPLILQITLTINTSTNGKTNEHASERVADKKVKSEVEHS